MNWGESEGEEKERWGMCRRQDRNSGLGGLSLLLIIPSFAVGLSDQTCQLHFTFNGLATVLFLPYSCMLPWCSWTINAGFFVPNVFDVCMHADRVCKCSVRWCLQLSRGRKEEGLVVMALHWHSQKPGFAAAQPYVLPSWLPFSRALTDALCPQLVLAYTSALQKCFSLGLAQGELQLGRLKHLLGELPCGPRAGLAVPVTTQEEGKVTLTAVRMGL